MTEVTSSAGRLYNILSKALVQDKEQAILKVWAETLGAEKVAYSEVSEKLADLFSLFNDVKQDIIQLDKSYISIGINALSKIQSPIIRIGLTGKWDQIKSQITQETIDNIKLCDGLLKPIGKDQRVIPKEKQEELLREVEKLIESFNQSSLPVDFKLELTRELIKIHNALINFDIRGEAHLQKVCFEVIGDITSKASQKPQLFREFKQSVKKVVNIVVMIGGLMTTYDLSIKYQPLLADQVINIIENMPDETDNITLQLKAVSEPQQMDAKIENNTNHKCLSSGEEE